MAPHINAPSLGSVATDGPRKMPMVFKLIKHMKCIVK